MDKAQKEPVTIEKQGRPVAVVISYDEYKEQYDADPSQQEKEQALAFLDQWSKRSTAPVKNALDGDARAEAIWNKYTQKS